MKKFRLYVLIGALFFFSTTQAQQRYATHSVKEGETIYSIAKQYRVTPYSILQENPEIKKVEEVKPNTILIVPVGKDYRGAFTTKEPKKEVAEEEPRQIEPIGYTRHRVRKRETLFSLTQKYDVTEEQIKRYNKALYSEPLKKGMVLQIPQYPELTEEEERELDFETYVVQPKETRWSIAHKYGITVDSLLVLNPNLPQNTSYLAVGQELELPRPKGDSLSEQEVTIFESYTVPKSMGLFRVSQNYGIPVDSVMKLNPEIAEIGGLKEGMVLRLPKPKPKEEEVNTENYLFYEVKPKQNIFRLTQNLKISRDSLYLLNPELENGLKAGMVLKLPKDKTEVLDVKNALVLDKFNLIDSLNINNRPNILVMLPFRLDRINFQNSEKTENQVASRRDITYAMGLYTGALVAMDSLKKSGISVNLKVMDTELSLDKVKLKLSQEPLFGVDAIFGPVGPDLLGEVAVQANTNGIPVIAPYADKSQLSLSNVFFSYPNDEVLRERILEHVAKMRENQSIIIIADEKHQEAKDSILAKFPMARVAKMSEDGSLHLVDFQTMLSEQEENWVFVETDQGNLAASVTSILNASNAEVIDEQLGEAKTIVVKMFTTNYNNAFEGESVSRPHLSNLDFTFPSAYRMVENNAFTKAYLRKFGHEPDRYAVRGFDLMMDLLLKLSYKKNLFESARVIGETEYSGNRFNYFNDWSSGFFNKATYLMQYDDLRIKQLEIK
ncbi:MAG: LysM peptidoglycan-binding domain-containing protein [Bacteroidota bacterium]